MKRNNHFILLFFILLFASLACNTSQPTASPATPHPLIVTLPADQQNPGTIPLSEAQVPRITADEARAAFDSGKAVIVDVRGPDAYAFGHAEGAINIPLGYFETDIENIQLEKDQWIITYCT
jgi:predicted sulfurtransferase